MMAIETPPRPFAFDEWPQPSEPPAPEPPPRRQRRRPGKAIGALAAVTALAFTAGVAGGLIATGGDEVRCAADVTGRLVPERDQDVDHVAGGLQCPNLRRREQRRGGDQQSVDVRGHAYACFDLLARKARAFFIAGAAHR